MSKQRLIFMAMLLGLLVSASSCKDDAPPAPGLGSPRYEGLTNLVFIYTELRGLEAPQDVYDYRDLWMNGVRGIQLWKPDEAGNPLPVYSNPYDSLYSRKGLYEKVTEMNGDVTFNKEVEHYREVFHNGYLQAAWLEDIIDVQVTAVTDYDAQHPAGSSLNDIAYMSYNTMYPYIKEGYRFNENSIGNGYYPALMEYYEGRPDDPMFWITKKGSCMSNSDNELRNHIKVTEIAANPLKVVSCDGFNPFRISFTEKPDGECKVKIAFTVQLRDSEYPQRILTTTGNVK